MGALEEDEDIQKRGFVVVSYHIGLRKVDEKILDSFRNLPILNDALPARFGAAHFCYDAPEFRPIVLFVQNAIARDQRLRFRAHSGTWMYLDQVLDIKLAPSQILAWVSPFASLQEHMWNVSINL